jgi:hypothetical protein
MATTYTSAVQELYVAYFNRPADPAGLDFWTKAVTAANGDTSAVAAAFATTPEYTATFTGMTNAQMVAAVYQNLFGRPADATGAAFWTAALDAKTITMANVVTSIAAGAQGTDAVIVTDKVAAASAFTAAIDTQAEIAGYSGVGANAAAKAWLSTVTDANSLTVALDPATLATTVANVVAAGTPFSLAGALGSLNQANSAVTSFLKATDIDSDPTTATTDATITAAKTAAVAKVAADLNGGAAGSTGSLFISTNSDSVRDALVTAQQTVNSANLAAAQQVVANDNAGIAKIAGLSSAVTTLTAANTALTAAQKAQITADADLAGKEAGFKIANASKGTFQTTTDTDGNITALVIHPTTGADITLATVNAAGKATVSADITASDYVGLTDMLASFNADANAAASVTKAQSTVDTANLNVNMLDIAPTSAGNVAGTSMTEAALLAAIATQINSTTPNTVANGSFATIAQIQTELAVLKAATDQTAYNSFKAMIDAETASGSTTATAAFNPLTSKLNADSAAVDSANKTISTLAKDVTALHSADATADTLAAYQATVAADTKLLMDKGYSVVTLDATHSGAATQFAGANSDVYVLNGHDATITAFGLQGSDSLFVGTGYTLVQGAIGATGVTANSAALEVFVSTNADGNAQLQIETHAYSSSVGGTDSGEVITITLTGVDAASLHLSTDGIITSSPATTA